MYGIMLGLSRLLLHGVFDRPNERQVLCDVGAVARAKNARGGRERTKEENAAVIV